MYLTIEGQPREFISLKSFRAERGLPAEFDVDYFERKIWVGLGSMNSVHATRGLEMMKQEVLKSVPASLKPKDLLRAVDELAQIFRSYFEESNRHIGLKPEEVDFAVSGFLNVMRDVAYELLRLHQLYRGDLNRIRDAFDFDSVYQHWLDSSTRISAMTHIYVHGEHPLKVRVIYNVYGRVGLEVRDEGQVFYLEDMSLACPASNYMGGLCEETTEKLCQTLFSELPES
jgi:hypothetical protein